MVHTNSVALLAASVLFAFSGSSHAQNSTGFKSCDALIQAGLGDKVLFGTDSDGRYNASVSSYYALTSSELTPWCILQPQSAQDVSTALVALSAVTGGGHWNVAVRGGGHSTWPNNNLNQGVTIDLSLLNETVITNATTTCGAPLSNTTTPQKIAQIGGGSRWLGAMRAAEEYGLSVTGGRVGSVGVAGLTLGGGFSFHSGQRGFACDDVVNYEVVLASGDIVNANAKQHADLFKALKGGSGNFGVVTRFDMNAFPAGDLYGGSVFYLWDQYDTVVDTFVNLINTNEDHIYDSMIVLYEFSSSTGSNSPLIGGIPVSTDGSTNSTSFATLDGLPAVIDTRAVQTYGDLLEAMDGAGGDRNIWFSLSFHNDKRVLDQASTIFQNLIDDMLAIYPTEEFNMIFVFQPLPLLFASYNPGGNVLGMDTTMTNNSILFLGEAFVATPDMQAVFQTKVGQAVSQLESYVESIGASNAFRYINYVNPTQDPLSSYGADNVAFMKQVSQTYDPNGFFQRRVSGGFKITDV